MPDDKPRPSDAILDVAIAAWFVSLDRIGGLTLAQEARYRRAMAAALEAIGVEFLEQNEGGPGVRLRSSEPG